jgi:DNA ligase-1
MEYAALVDVYERLEATSSNLEKTAILAEALADAEEAQLPLLVKLLRGKLFAAWEAAELGISSRLTKAAIATATGVDEDAIEATWRDTGDLGDAAAEAVANRKQRTLVTTRLDVRTVHDTLQELATYEGEGSQERRIEAVAGLLNDADSSEARYVVRTVLGHLRVGIGDGTVRDAIADAFLDGSDAAIEAVERAHQVTNDYRTVARTAKRDGVDGLTGLDVELFRPVEVMLAQKAAGLPEGIDEVADDGAAVRLEHKFDGVRTQIHRDGDDIRVFTRRLEDVTAQFPDVVTAVGEHVDATECIIEGEIVGYDPDTGEVLPFQTLSKRIRRKYDVEETATEIPVTVHLFDCLYRDGESLLDASLRVRLAALEAILAPEPGAIELATHRTAEATIDDGEGGGDERGGDTANGQTENDTGETVAEADREFYAAALDAGHEGVMLKNAAASYQPGRRVGYMMKVKPTMEPLDLVVTRAQWSEGRRSEFLGRLFLACRDAESGDLREVGRLATGYTDEELRDLTARLEPLVTERDGRRVDLRPEVVLEIEYEEIQPSPEYDSGFALRFPRFVRVRDDLGPTDADTLDRVSALHDQQ